MSVPLGAVAVSIVPSTPSGAVAIVASVMLAVFVAIFTFLALAPTVSETWTEQLSAPTNDSPSIEQSANDAD